MSLLDTASLVVTPNGTKASKLYSVVPSSGSGDLDVTRATTATRVNSSGLIESVASNVPRLDYTNGSCPSILVEPQRTNLVLNSEDFSGGSESLVTYTANTTDTLSPSGNNTVDKFAVTTSGGDAHTRIPKTISVQNFSLSIYVKGNAGQKLQLFLARDGFAELKSQNYTLNGNWQRVVLSDSFSTTSSSVVIGIEFGFNAIDSVAGQVYYVWGAQLEAGSYATSYIPTTSASVTRNADVISKTGISSLIGQTEGVIYLDFLKNNTTALFGDGLFEISDSLSSPSNRILFAKYPETTDIFFQIKHGGSNINTSPFPAINNAKNKVAISYKTGSTKIYANGVLVESLSDSFSFSSSLNSINLGNYQQSNIALKTIDLFAIWTTKLTNTQLAQLTTI
jgi:hypothetical protein